MAEPTYSVLVKKLNIDPDRIIDDLSPYYTQVSNRYMKKSKIERAWGSVETFVNVLYWIKFVMKLDNFEMDELTGVKDFYKVYRDLGWNYNTFDFQECQKMHVKELERLNSFLEHYDPTSPIFDSEDYLNRKNKIHLKPTSVTRIIHNYKVDDIEDLIKLMYYLVYVAKLTTFEIALLFEKDSVTVLKLLKKFNMSLTSKEARKRIEEQGRGNHRQSAITGKKSIISRSIKNGVTDNNAENICRTLIETRLYSYLDITNYEFIVGLSSYSIIPPQEIDIPIIIYEKTTKKYYRYAIELDGAFWHEKSQESDVKKNGQIASSSWKLIRIWFTSFERSNENVEILFRRMTDKICSIILSDIKGAFEEWSVKILDGF